MWVVGAQGKPGWVEFGAAQNSPGDRLALQLKCDDGHRYALVINGAPPLKGVYAGQAPLRAFTRLGDTESGTNPWNADIFSVSLVPGLPPPPPPSAGPKTEALLRALFESCDVDGSGTITRAEATEAVRTSDPLAQVFGFESATRVMKWNGTGKMFQEAFDAIDTNRDGVLTWEELRRWKDHVRAAAARVDNGHKGSRKPKPPRKHSF